MLLNLMPRWIPMILLQESHHLMYPPLFILRHIFLIRTLICFQKTDGAKSQTPSVAGASREDYAGLCVLCDLDFYPARCFGCKANPST